MQNDPILEDIHNIAKGCKDVEAAILFGSVARGDDTLESDVDICLVLKDPNATQDLSVKFLDLEKKHDRDINVVFTDRIFSGLDRYFVETLLKDGSILAGAMPPIPTGRLELEPYEIIRFDLRTLGHADKMRIKRQMYGMATMRKYKRKVYRSTKRGLIEDAGGIRIGIASVLVPEKHIGPVEDLLRAFNVPHRKMTVWMSRP